MLERWIRSLTEKRTLHQGATSLDDHEIIAKVNFDPDALPFESTERRKFVLIRWSAQRRALYFHSVVSEFETWRIERPLPE